jgi:hypothetical protein
MAQPGLVWPVPAGMPIIDQRSRRGGRADECGGLENRYPSLGGSRVRIPPPPPNKRVHVREPVPMRLRTVLKPQRSVHGSLQKSTGFTCHWRTTGARSRPLLRSLGKQRTGERSSRSLGYAGIVKVPRARSARHRRASRDGSWVDQWLKLRRRSASRRQRGLARKRRDRRPGRTRRSCARRSPHLP